MEKITDPATGFISVDKLYRKLKKEGVSREQIEEAIAEMQTYQVNTPSNQKIYNSIKSSFIGDVIQADLMDVQNISTVNKNIKFLLTFIDVYSRFVLVEPLKNKNQNTVAEAMERIIRRFPKDINNLTTDDGSEFNNKAFKKVMKKFGIEHWITPAGTPNKLAIIERFHRTLRNRLDLYFDYTRKKQYIDVLDDLISNYNNTYHRTIKTEPAKILKGKDTNHQDYNKVEQDLIIGDTVRKTLKRGKFDKGSSKFSDKVYEIDEVYNNSYSIRNPTTKKKLSRRFMRYELKKVINKDNKTDNYKETISKIATKRRRQKKEPAFNDKNTHDVDDYGNVRQTRKHLIPERPKRERKAPKKLDL